MKKPLNEEFKRMQQLAGILNEEFTKPVPPLRIWNKKNNEGNETYYITNPVLGTDKEVGFSKPEIEALHRLIEEWFKSQQSGFNRSEAVNTPDKNRTQALVRIKKLEGFDVEISRQEGSQIKGYGVEGGGGGGECIIKVANMYQLKDDKNLKEATPTSESTNIEKSVNEALRKYRRMLNESEYKKSINEEASKVYTIGDWFGKDNYDPNQKLGVHRGYNYSTGLILGFTKGNKGEEEVILAPQIVTDDGKNFPSQPFVETISQIIDVSKPGIEIKYDENKVKDNIKKLGLEGEKIPKIEQTSRGYELFGWRDGHRGIINIDVSNWIK